MAVETLQKSKILEGLNHEQEQAVTHCDGPLLIIAGAGTGKTTVLTRRIAWLIGNQLAQPKEILALTFTEKAAAEMLDRVDQLMPLGYEQMDISTFHSFAQRILTDHAIEIGLPGDFKIITDIKAWLMLKQHLSDLELNYYRPLGNPNKFLHALLKHFGKAKGERITPSQYLEFAQGLSLNFDQTQKVKGKRKKKEEIAGVEEQEAQRIMEVASAYHHYQKLLLDQGFLDFGDLINYSISLFKTRPKLLELYRKKYKYILIDEFQDTDLSQYELVRLLAEPTNNITVVGDDDQSIYKFRGASISNILKFKEDYPKAEQVALVKNYRSSQAILNLSYDFIQLNNPERLESRLKISKKLQALAPENGEIEVLHGTTVMEEAKLVADKITSLMLSQKLNFNDFAILVRANDHAEPFLSQLSKRGIPYMFVANRGLYRKPFVLDLLAYFNLLDNYHESENLFRVLNLSLFKISDADLINLSHAAKRLSLSLYESIKEIPRSTKVSQESEAKIKELLRLLENHTNLARNNPVSEVLIKVINDLKITEALTDDTLACQENRSLLEQLYKKTLNYENDNADKSLKGFLTLLKLEQEAGDTGDLAFDPDSGPEAVKIMTVHSAKGLEFSCVFVVNLVDQRFPSRERKEQIEIPVQLVQEILSEGDVHLMEERRLFYVALTRAKRYLYLTWASDYGGLTMKKPSQFLIESRLIEKPAPVKASGKVFFEKPATLPLPETDSYKLPLPDAFDFSQISTFLKCPLEYKYKYIYKLPMPGSAPFSFGSTMHQTLKKFMQSVKQLNNAQASDLFGNKQTTTVVPPKDQLLKFYAESWIEDWYPDKINKENYRKEGARQLAAFYDYYCANPLVPKYLEQPFQLRIGDYKFKGRIDRADLNADQTITIIDYKTGEPRTKLEKVDKDQLLIYQWAAMETMKEKVKELRYVYLKDIGQQLPFLGSDEELKALKERILATIQEIVAAVSANDFLKRDQRVSHDCQFRHFEQK
ncbi:MAG: ATP-dependent helicase [Acidobacteriaceae bacterium]